jgi:hypothetical protein
VHIFNPDFWGRKWYGFRPVLNRNEISRNIEAFQWLSIKYSLDFTAYWGQKTNINEQGIVNRLTTHLNPFLKGDAMD